MNLLAPSTLDEGACRCRRVAWCSRCHGEPCRWPTAGQRCHAGAVAAILGFCWEDPTRRRTEDLFSALQSSLLGSGGVDLEWGLHGGGFHLPAAAEGPIEPHDRHPFGQLRLG